MSCILSPSFVSNDTRQESRGRRIQDHSQPYLLPSSHREVELWRRGQSITSKHLEVNSQARVVDSLVTDLITVLDTHFQLPP